MMADPPPIPNPIVHHSARYAVDENSPTVEYAGFRYRIVLGLKGQGVMAIPMSGQHKAAGKVRHCRAAVQKFNEERERV